MVFVIAPDSFESTQMKAVGIILPMLIGYYGPRKWIDGRVEARKEEIISGFPDALDMLLICVEVGSVARPIHPASLDRNQERLSGAW